MHIADARYNLSDCIFAPITAIEGSPVIVVRISGNRQCVEQCLLQLGANIGMNTLYPPGASSIGPTVRVSNLKMNGKQLDKVVITLFCAPRSLTGEDVAEISFHGSQFILKSVCDALSSIYGVRHAEAGEFLYRAFMHGKLTLEQAEGVHSLINSTTEAQHAISMERIKGAGIKMCKQWRDGFIDVLSDIEGLIDFSGENHLPEDRNFVRKISALHQEISYYLDRASANKIFAGTSLVLVGKPNAGKSSLFNALTCEEASIVSNIPGTTRDIISSDINILGIPAKIYDTAGIAENTDDPIEQEGMRRAGLAVASADVVLFVMDAPRVYSSKQYADNVRAMLLRYCPKGNAETESGRGDESGRLLLPVMHKSDLLPAEARTLLETWARNVCGQSAVFTSCTGGSSAALDGEDELLKKVHLLIKHEGENPETNLNYLNLKQNTLLRQALLRMSLIEQEGGLISEDIIAEEIRQILELLSGIIEAVDPEEVLGEVFSKFCVGK